MTSTKPLDSKREEFRKYLERTGVMDALTRVFCIMYEAPEKPADALSFFYKSVAEDRPEKVELAEALKELEDERAKVAKLTSELEEAHAKIAALENVTTESRTSPSHLISKESDEEPQCAIKVEPDVEVSTAAERVE